MTYRHTQIGRLTLALIGAATVFAALATANAPGLAPKMVVLFLVLLLYLFSSLTTRVEGRSLTVYFGPGIIRRTIALDEVREVRVVRNPWYCGWGIRHTGSGWMWNVSGLGAVELEYKEGGRFRIGTDEPEKLVTAVRTAMGRH